MKKLIMLLLSFIAWDSSVFAQCERNAIVFSLSPGYSKTGPSLSMEAGLWPVISRVGIMGGVAMYSQKQVIKGKEETFIDLDVTGRLLYKITRTGSDYPQLFTLFASIRGMYGASYRAYFSPSEDLLIGIEPTVSNKTGLGINILLTTRL